MEEILSDQHMPFINPFQQTFAKIIIKTNNNKGVSSEGRIFSYFTVIVVADEFTIYNVYNCNVLYKIERFLKESKKKEEEEEKEKHSFCLKSQWDR